MTSEEIVTPDRMNAFSDGVFAVIITILVLELRPPKEASFGALLDLWPAAISYLFIAIVWVNHHHLLLYAYTFVCNVGALCRRGSRSTSPSDRWHGDDLPLPIRLAEPRGTALHTSTQVARVS
jgi:hypothetical protein